MLLLLFRDSLNIGSLEEMARIFDKDTRAVLHEGAVIDAFTGDPEMNEQVPRASRIENNTKQIRS